MKTESRMAARGEGWGWTQLAWNGNTARNDENVLMASDNRCCTVWLCVMLLNGLWRYTLPRDRLHTLRRWGSVLRLSDVTKIPGSFSLWVDHVLLLPLFDLEMIAACLEAVSMYWAGKAKHHLLAKLFSFTKGNPGDCLLIVRSPKLDYIMSQHRARVN